MSTTYAALDEPRRATVPGAGWLLLVAAGFQVAQLSATGGAGYLGLLLLAVVHVWRSRAARALLVISGWFGVVVLAWSSLAEPHRVLVALAFLGQTAPLMTARVRRHVGSSNQAPTRSPYAWLHSFARSS